MSKTGALEIPVALPLEARVRVAASAAWELKSAPDKMIRAERRALLRADASALRDADREVVRTR